jgi:hypothetical protein
VSLLAAAMAVSDSQMHHYIDMRRAEEASPE